MKAKVLLFIFLLSTVFSLNSYGSITLHDEGQWNNHYYEIYISTDAISWSNAKTAAESLNFNGEQGYLATITSEEENTFVSSLLGSEAWVNNDKNGYMGPWLGGTDAATEGTWVWVTTGEDFSYFAWESNQDGVETDQDFLHYYTQYDSDGPVGEMTWNDYADIGALDSGKVFGYVVEYNAVPIPGSIVLLGGALIGLAGIKKRK